VGEDERTIAQANSLVEGGTAVAGLAGPALAGLLIPLIGAPNVLYVDAATYVVSFALLSGLVPRTRRIAAGAAGGVLGGIRFFLRDRLLGPLGTTLIVLNFVGAAVSATIPFYAYTSFGESAGVAGLFYTAGGAGALAGSVVAVAVTRRFPPLRLAGAAIVAMTLPLWVLPLGLPAAGVAGLLFAMMFFAPLVNGPAIGLITARTPVELRPKVMAALVSVSTLATPLGFLAAGQLLGRWHPETVVAATAVGMTASALVFATIAFRAAGREEAPEAPAVAPS
jgi:predicted MFS family arabinose efflux permease